MAAISRELSGRLSDHFVDRTDVQPRRDRRLRVSAARLVGCLGELKGAFAKAGQFLSLRHDIVPPELRDALGSLQDRVPPLPLASIQEVVESELGRPLADCFPRFDPTPLGAASIAQVHRARLPDGGDVAVKVQYPWIAASLPADLALLRLALGLWLRFGGTRSRGVDVDVLFSEFAAGLQEELDFEREGRVAGEIAANLGSDPQILVPEIHPDFSSRRVLTMSYHPCVSVNDGEGLERLGVSPEAVLEVLTRAYAKQVFVDGLFHADPHPGNLFVVDEPRASETPRVLFVDFGLSKHLSPELRDQMRQGIYAVLQRDLDAFMERMSDMEMIAPGAEAGVRAAVAGMFERIAGAGGQAGVLGSSGEQILSLKDEAKRLLQDTPGLQLPNDLLLYAKTLSYLFALGQEIAPSVDLMKLSLPYLLRFLAGLPARAS
jgi:predicted unusual protein kinase regulating ubiquinone biosynthesis (AarF/ABC1/UbiB family)